MDLANWIIRDETYVSKDSNLANLVLTARGFDKAARQNFLNPDYQKDLYDPFLLANMQKAVKRIVSAIKNGEQIVIYGDYDIDGITSTGLLIDGLSQFGAKVEYYIPDRFEEGYGLNITALKKLKKGGAKLIITVDCGITAVEQIAKAKKLDLDIIVTDHHNPPQKLPKDAIALINPKLKTNKYPFDGLAGVGVAFKLICALQKHLPDKIPEGREKWLLDLVALGTVCDAVDLIDENRLLVKYGLVVMGKTKRAGLQALAKVAGINLDQIDSRSLGFIFGPRLNAAGRIEHANAALKLLLTNDQHEAFKIAQKLDKLNRQRQADTEKITKEALTQAKQYPDDKILVLADKHWSHGIVGIVASRISESFYKPAIILQIEGDSAKGSARSVASFSIIEAIASTKKYLEQFGGHQFAAGVRLKTASIDKFRTAVNRYAKENLKDKNKIKNLEIDLVLADKLINLDSLARLVALEPFGNGNVEPHFLSSLKLAEYRLVGKDSKHVKLTFTGEAGPVEGIAFSCAERFNGVKAGEIFDIVYKMKINNWREIQNVQIEVVDFKLSSPDLNSGK